MVDTNPTELRERAVRMVLDHANEYGSQWEAICSVADTLDPLPETVRRWVRRQGRRKSPPRTDQRRSDGNPERPILATTHRDDENGTVALTG